MSLPESRCRAIDLVIYHQTRCKLCGSTLRLRLPASSHCRHVLAADWQWRPRDGWANGQTDRARANFCAVNHVLRWRKSWNMISWNMICRNCHQLECGVSNVSTYPSVSTLDQVKMLPTSNMMSFTRPAVRQFEGSEFSLLLARRAIQQLALETERMSLARSQLASYQIIVQSSEASLNSLCRI